jgi:hypothetical protein
MKTTKVTAVGVVAYADHATIGMMPWEAPKIRIEVDGRSIIWHSESVENQLHNRFGLGRVESLRGKTVRFSALVRGDRVFRMQSLEVVA